MKYYLLTMDQSHPYVGRTLHRLLYDRQEVSPDAWEQAGGHLLAGDAPLGTLWEARPAHLLIDDAWREPWIAEFGDRGLLTTAIGNKPMFLIVPPASSEGVNQEGHWRQHHFFSTYLWPPHNQQWFQALHSDLREPVVRGWDGRALAPLYSEDVIDWLRSQGCSGVSFTLVWDPARAAPMPVTHYFDHECIEL